MEFLQKQNHLCDDKIQRTWAGKDVMDTFEPNLNFLGELDTREIFNER